MADRHIRRGLIGAIACAVVACAVREELPRDVARAPLAGFPVEHYARMLAEGKSVYAVDTAASVAIVLVRRSGSLARFGHDHVVASHDVAGSIAPDEGRVDLAVPLDTLAVDEPALRAEAGLDTQPSPADVAATRHNMLDKVLEAERYPHLLVSASGIEDRDGMQRVRASVTLHGVTRVVDASVQIVKSSMELTVSGAMAIDQSSFGIVPFSVLGGAIAVQDRLDVSFRLHATRLRRPV